MPDFMSFNEFIDHTNDARVGHHIETLRAGLTRLGMGPAKTTRRRKAASARVAIKDDVAEKEFEQMKRYVLDFYRGVRATHTFMDSAGNFIDCVPFEQQPSVRAEREAGRNVAFTSRAPTLYEHRRRGDPMKFGPDVSPINSPLRRGLRDVFGNRRACPEGSVPMRRVTLARLAWHGKLEAFFHKAPPGGDYLLKRGRGGRAKAGKTAQGSAARFGKASKTSGMPAPVMQAYNNVAPDGSIHPHAICQTEGDFTGCFTWLNIWRVSAVPNGFNLSQLWILGDRAEPRSPAGMPATIESGWQTFNNELPHLFVYYNPDGYGSGASYAPNRGFVQKSNAWHPGGHLDPDQVSTLNGPQHGLQMQWERDDDGTWHLYVGYDNEDAHDLDEVGCFPAQAYQNTGLSRSGAVLQFGGECASGKGDPQRRTGNMGSGQAPSGDPDADWKKVAFQMHIAVKSNGGDSWDDPEDLHLASRPDGAPNYMASKPDKTEGWGRYFFFGGDHGP
jgi:hypothetical protein